MTNKELYYLKELNMLNSKVMKNYVDFESTLFPENNWRKNPE